MHRPTRPLPSAAGFTLMEMSVVLVIIALIIGAVSVGRDVYRSAEAERIGSEFVQGWIVAYDRYVQQSGVVPGDTPANPSGRINGQLDRNGRELCDDPGNFALRKAMLERGVALPQGRAEGMESFYVYRDSQGNPQQLQVCFDTVVDWSEPTPTGGYQPRVRNIMVLKGLTPELANQLDARIDGRIDACFGRLREQAPIPKYSGGSSLCNVAVGSSTPSQPRPWTEDDTQTRDGRQDGLVKVMTGYLRMNQ
ncbi:cleavage protein [Stenotrophomonas acidaminiphila]|uniref:Cleavage protein n=1 Tax=Stenotrophomonas acidaminiphila TaxID=128780 RepID=A0A0S1B2I7_9GAMM|nr:prepilin-type N-terminal cleavage/methylation domain-containing protein [Stenotrophomonas acidaminiphila]ALJ29253.1 cleavage protein [Stenotrophomonas acidaminiphila]